MKFLNTHFDEYISANKKADLHPNLTTFYNRFPDNIDNFENLLFYGPTGVGKYTQMLASILKYSPSELKSDKKMCVVFNKINYYYKISDIHVEIDMSLLGCNSKLLWNDIYIQLIDVAYAKPKNTLIVVCKNFQNIHSELLEIFYSYMQTTSYMNVCLKFIIITNSVCFIPSAIVNKCKMISVSRPTKTTFAKCIKGVTINKADISSIINIKNLQANQQKNVIKSHVPICNNILEKITNTSAFNYIQLRDILYDILIYDMDVYECIWYIMEELIRQKKLTDSQIVPTLKKVFMFFQYYNNNYRPIYHLESIMFYLIENIEANNGSKNSL